MFKKTKVLYFAINSRLNYENLIKQLPIKNLSSKVGRLD